MSNAGGSRVPSMQSWLGRFFDRGGAVHNARAYGILGDGMQDETAALAGLEATIGPGDVIVFPPGRYVWDTWTWTKPRRVFAVGAHLTKITGGTRTMGHLVQDLTGASSGSEVVGGTWHGNRDAYQGGVDTVSLFHFINAFELSFQNVTCVDSVEEFWKMYGCQRVTWRDCRGDGARNNGIQIHTPEGVATQDSWGLKVFGGEMANIDDGRHGLADGHGVTVNATSTRHTTYDVQVVGMTVRNCIRGLWAEFGGGRDRLQGRDIRFLDNWIHASEFYGMGMIGVLRGKMNGNHILDTGRTTIDRGRRPTTSDEITGLVIGGDRYAEGESVEARGNEIHDTRGERALMQRGIWVKRGIRHRVKDNHVTGSTVRDVEAGWPFLTASEVLGAEGRPMVKTDDSGAQIIRTGGGPQDLSWDRVEADTDGMHPGGDADTLTVRTAGRYQVAAGLRWPSNSRGYRRLQVVRNGASVIAEDLRLSVSGDEGGSLAFNPLIELDAGDTIKAATDQNSGIDLRVDLRDPRCYLAMTYLGPKGA